MVGDRLKNRFRGKRAKAFGGLFEDIFSRNCLRTGIGITRIPDGCRRLSHTRLIQIKSPFDWICSYQGKSIFIDTKTNQGNAFQHSLIDEHQVKSLRMHETRGAIAGYVIWLRKPDQVLFVPAGTLEKRMQIIGSISVESVHSDGIICLGSQIDFNLFPLFQL